MMALQKFSRDVSGAIAPLFALIFIPIFGLAMTAYDYNRATAVKAELQHAVDNAANAAAQRLGGPVEDLNDLVAAFLKSNLSKKYQHYPFKMRATKSSVTVTMHERVLTTLLSFAGVPYIEVNVESTVEAPRLPEVESLGHVPLAELGGSNEGFGNDRAVSSSDARAAERDLRAVIEELDRSGEMSSELRQMLGDLH